jgi:ATP-dependent Clp protease ATP-binding subunit ClpC
MEELLQEAAKYAAEFGRPEVDTEHLLLALNHSDVIKTILGQFKIKVDDLTRQIESEAKRGDKPFEGEIGVSPRRDALVVLSWHPTNWVTRMSARNTS